MLTRFLALAVIWAGSFTFIRVAVRGLTPGQLVLARLLLGAAVLLVFARARRVALPSKPGVWGQLTVAAALSNVIPFLLLSYGERTTGAGLAAVLVGATPLLTLAIASAALPAERATTRTALGLGAGFVGVVVVVSPWSHAGGPLPGQLACLGAALSYAAGFVYVRRSISPLDLPALALAAAQLTAAVVLTLVVTPFLRWRAPDLDARVVGSVLALGVLGTGVAYVLYFTLVSGLGATRAATVNYVIPVFAVLIAAVVLDERITVNLAIGGVVILVGVRYAARRPRAPVT